MSKTVINNNEEIANLLDSFYDFHDSFITKITNDTSHFLGDEGQVVEDEKKNTVEMTFINMYDQTLELKFEEVQVLNINTNIIKIDYMLDCAFFKEDDLFYWANTSGWDRNITNYSERVIYVIAKKVSYKLTDRVIDNLKTNK